MTSTIKANGITKSVIVPYKDYYNVSSNSELVSALNDMGSSIPADRSIAYYALRTIDNSGSNAYIPPSNYACIAHRLAAGSAYLVVFMFSYGTPDVYMYRNANGQTNERYITKLSGTDIHRW